MLTETLFLVIQLGFYMRSWINFVNTRGFKAQYLTAGDCYKEAHLEVLSLKQKTRR